MVGDFRGSEGYNDSGNIVAGNPKVYQAILQAIAPFLTPDLAR
jgi:myo-inositol-1(or 4)-monophosphatase